MSPKYPHNSTATRSIQYLVPILAPCIPTWKNSPLVGWFNRLEVLGLVGKTGGGSKAIFLRLFCIIMALNNSHKLGLALFALGIIIFFGQQDVLGYLSIIASLLVPPESGFYIVILQSYYVIYALSVFLIIAGVIMFYKGRTKTSNLTSSSTPTER